MESKNQNSTKKFMRLELWFEILRTIVAIGLSLGIVLVIVAIVSDQPFQAIWSLMVGPFSTFRRFGNVIEVMIPLTFTGLAITIVFKSKRFNLVSDSAFYLGSMIATLVGVFSPYSPVVTIILALLAAILVGGILGFIPAILNHKFGANELVTSLMMNYVIGFYVKYLFNYKVRDASKAAMQSLPLKPGVGLRNLIPGTRIHTGLLIMLFLVVLSWIVIYKTKWGYALRATGSNEKFARYSGIKVAKVFILAQVVGTSIAALGGAVEMLGVHKTFKWMESPGYGFDGVILATLARGNPALIPLASFFLAYVRVGADILNRTSDIPAEIVSVVQATIILLIAAQAFLAKYKHKLVVKQAQEAKESEAK